MAHIVSLKGFGPWSARYILVRGAGFADTMPYDDLALVRRSGDFTGTAASRRWNRVKRSFDRWRPYRRLAGYCLLLDSILPGAKPGIPKQPEQA